MPSAPDPWTARPSVALAVVSLLGAIVLFALGVMFVAFAAWGDGVILITLAILAARFGVGELNGWVDSEGAPRSTPTGAAGPRARATRRRSLLALAASGVRLSRPLRLAFFIAGLVVLAVTYAATGSAALQLLVVFALTFSVLPFLTRRFGRPDDFAQAVRRRNVPAGVFVRAGLFGVVWYGLVILVAPAIGLGPWFAFWLGLGPSVEVFAFVAERRFKRDGGAEDWPPFRPLHASATAALIIAPLIAGITLLRNQSVEAALATGAAYGVTGFLSAAAVTRAWRRAGTGFAEEADTTDRPLH